MFEKSILNMKQNQDAYLAQNVYICFMLEEE